MIYIVGPKNSIVPPKNAIVVNTTSHSSESWSRELSPFFLGPCDLYGDYKSKNVENAWQFSKVYAQYVDTDGNPSNDYFRWALTGWQSERAQRYPMGKGVKPLYSYWDNEKLGYVDARKNIYVPLYAKSVIKTNAFVKLYELSKSNDIALWDFDAYSAHRKNMRLDEVFNDETKPVGHAWVLKLLLDYGEWDIDKIFDSVFEY